MPPLEWEGRPSLQDETTRHPTAPRIIAIDMDGTLLGDDGRVSPRNLAALQAAHAAGVEIVVATGRRHSYAMRVLRPLGLHPASPLISSNGTVTRTLGAASPEVIPSELIARTHLPLATALWLCAHLDEFRNALVLTFDRLGPNGEDARGALVVEHLDELNASIGRWMAANEPYIDHVIPIERALAANGVLDAPIQAMLCGTMERMARAEARLLEHAGVTASGQQSGRSATTLGAPQDPGAPQSLGAPSSTRSLTARQGGVLSPSDPNRPGAPSFAASSQRAGRNPLEPSSLSETTEPTPNDPVRLLTLHRTEYPDRDLSILDILPAGCSKGAALLALAASRGIDPAQILAIGDNWNDVSMLEVAGAAVLMANAPPDLKLLAAARGWRIGPSNRNDGVADAIESALHVPC